MTATNISAKTYDRASLALILVVLGIVLATFNDYGITWDEPLQDEYGDLVVDYYTSRIGSGERSNQALEFRNLYLYGGAFDATVSLLQNLSPLPRFETRHLLTALVGLAGIFGCWRLTRLVSGPAAAFWATCLLVVTPRFYGHMFNNPKDIPFAVGYVWSVYYLVQASRHLPKVPAALSAKLGIVIGLTMGVRIGGLILLCYLGLILAIFWGYLVVSRERRSNLAGDSGQLALSFLKVALPAYLIMLAAWPWAQQSPLRRPLTALERIGSFRWKRPVLYQGIEYKAPDLPDSYYSHYFSITLPEIFLVLLALGAMASLLVLVRRRASLDSIQLPAMGITVLAATYPLIHVAVTHAVVYDGIRHMLFVLAPLACIAGTTLALLLRRTGTVAPRLQTLLLLALGAYFAFHLSVMMRLHPYQTVYFNRLTGGLAGAAGKYETDYWGNSYREAALELEQFLDSKKNRDPERIFRAKVCSTHLSSAYYFPSYLRRTGKDGRADFYIATTRWHCDQELEGRVIAKVERYGVPLAIVKDRRHLRRNFD